MSDFGAGPLLTSDLDFEVTNTGDIRAAQGLSELEKDVGLQSLIELSEFYGSPETPKVRSQIEVRVRRVLTREPRIDQIIGIQVLFLGTDNLVEIAASVVADDEEQELVFTI